MTLTVAGEDAEAEYASLHPPHTVERYASDASTGVLGRSKASQAEGASVESDVVANSEAGGDWWTEALDGMSRVLLVKVRVCENACYSLVPSVIF